MTRSFEIFGRRGAAYVQLNGDLMLCIGTVGEVARANAEQIADMIEKALAFGAFRAIETGAGLTKH